MSPNPYGEILDGKLHFCPLKNKQHAHSANVVSGIFKSARNEKYK